MKIIDAKVIVSSPGRNFITLKVTTEDGIYGLGDATLNGRELAVASYLTEHLIPLLIGRDARRIEDIWQYLYKGAYWRRGPVTMCSIAAVDTALWDIKGKALNVPVYQLLGGASRDGVLVYGHANGPDIEETVQAVADYIKLGYKAIRAQSGIPGLQSTYGVGRGKLYYEPAEKNAPLEDAWSSDLYLNFVPRLFERLRKEFGADLPLLHDVHHRLTPIEAARLGKSLEPFHLFWLEDPVPAELQESFRAELTLPFDSGLRDLLTSSDCFDQALNGVLSIARVRLFDRNELIPSNIIQSLANAGGPAHFDALRSHFRSQAEMHARVAGGKIAA